MCVYLTTKKNMQKSCNGCRNCKASCHLLNFPSEGQNANGYFTCGNGTHFLVKKNESELQKRINFEEFVCQLQSNTNELETKNAKIIF